ncbi:MAG: GerMN domain-containing protein [Armatimonadota bacterium]|nr:GerMN domain-containing protein [Armatimonadota bacterium]MDW8154966.1 GerMN domain-containing protein [Armatimonadota bacterium]
MTLRRWVLFLLLAAVALAAWALWDFRPRTQPALVYFVQWDPHTNSGQLVAGLRWVRGRTRADWVAGAVRELLAGPTAEEQARGYSTEIPRGTRLLGVRVRGRTAYVDLSREFESGGGSASMLARLYQVLFTATHFPGVDEVRVEIEGRVRESLGGEGLLVDVPVRRPPTAPRF